MIVELFDFTSLQSEIEYVIGVNALVLVWIIAIVILKIEKRY